MKTSDGLILFVIILVAATAAGLIVLKIAADRVQSQLATSKTGPLLSLLGK